MADMPERVTRLETAFTDFKVDIKTDLNDLRNLQAAILEQARITNGRVSTIETERAVEKALEARERAEAAKREAKEEAEAQQHMKVRLQWPVWLLMGATAVCAVLALILNH